MATESNLAIGIVGGGHAGLQLLNLLGASDLARPVFVVDPRQDAPASIAAREANIPTFTDIRTAIHTHKADMVFELVGRPEAAEELQTVLAGTGIRLVEHMVAYTILSITQEDRQRVHHNVEAEIHHIKAEIDQSLGGSQSVVSDINQIMNMLQMLALNASIEAAKVGIHGKGFMVVADSMSKSVERVRKMTHEIEAVNNKINTISQKIDLALAHLK
ncbi:MAG TPA: methyl-accepting chemotaxis protein [Holophaga sp.]|nr:methyl-accepting chemotaxis protein [Holophaga sp.]